MNVISKMQSGLSINNELFQNHIGYAQGYFKIRGQNILSSH